MEVRIQGRYVGKSGGDIVIRQGDCEVYMVPWGVSEDAERHLEQLLDQDVFLVCEVLYRDGVSGIVKAAYPKMDAQEKVPTKTPDKV